MSIFNRLPGAVVSDSDGFPPVHPGAVAVKFGTLAYTDTTDKLLFTLPRGAEIVGWQVVITTAFNDSGTDVIDLSDGVTSQRFAASLTASAQAILNTGFVVGELFATPLTADTGVYGKYTGQNANASAGAATVAVFYILR